ncbi:uncharacterized protein BJ171DRAFT_493882 [Polychytrium aggregatum]|uniref:uncharacterized protein n=1 Tax=Polychytrium aggregatum TaxID=110093 RepID=UPI0022FEF49A|nr:uncharacterized protein BJ171DRAFT_493882 [Polychytrium aggregatum]KAI9207203.1 hypothetical protein BJ171DRAFT_493882 [Polychytrium aggregatum]
MRQMHHAGSTDMGSLLQNQELEREVDANRRKIEYLSSELVDVSDTAAYVTAMNDSIEHSHESREEEMKETISDLEEIVADLRDQVYELNSEIRSLQVEKDSVIQRYEDLQAKYYIAAARTRDFRLNQVVEKFRTAPATSPSGLDPEPTKSQLAVGRPSQVTLSPEARSESNESLSEVVFGTLTCRSPSCDEYASSEKSLSSIGI